MTKEELEKAYNSVKSALVDDLKSSEDRRVAMLITLMDEQVKQKVRIGQLNRLVNVLSFLFAALSFCVATLCFFK